ncbi:hypothetical protein ACFQI7_20700 [Paenibacillus allorhizosphaerae]|uniref:UTRA domain-containing protein n=1 Tax=Paenibacillus allorhizosphaerae TaxID=2849866 RepID=A0ABM8VLC7_9BACL|nr:hypothetical protein [Paenibacillus allorhizosphaerae]CAG7647870.1 hypothetical protein PAECIP111802_04084 [Paenibacillus allorhizosphaerae]
MVVYNYNEVPKELLVDHSYTLRQIRLFMTVNKNCLFLHKDLNALDAESNKKVSVVSRDEYYIHQYVERSYLIPYEKKVVFLLSQADDGT